MKLNEKMLSNIMGIHLDKKQLHEISTNSTRYVYHKCQLVESCDDRSNAYIIKKGICACFNAFDNVYGFLPAGYIVPYTDGAEASIKTVSNVVIISISIDALKRIMNRENLAEELHKIRSSLLEEEIYFAKKPLRERVSYLQDNGFFKFIPSYLLASYLNITVQHLCRIKRELLRTG